MDKYASRFAPSFFFAPSLPRILKYAVAGREAGSPPAWTNTLAGDHPQPAFRVFVHLLAPSLIRFLAYSLSRLFAPSHHGLQLLPVQRGVGEERIGAEEVGGEQHQAVGRHQQESQAGEDLPARDVDDG